MRKSVVPAVLFVPSWRDLQDKDVILGWQGLAEEHARTLPAPHPSADALRQAHAAGTLDVRALRVGRSIVFPTRDVVAWIKAGGYRPRLPRGAQ